MNHTGFASFSSPLLCVYVMSTNNLLSISKEWYYWYLVLMVSLLEPLVLYLFTFPHANVQVQGLRDSSWKKHIEDSTHALKVCMLSNFSFLNLYCFRMFMSQSNEWTNPSLHIYSLDPLKSKLGSCTWYMGYVNRCEIRPLG